LPQLKAKALVKGYANVLALTSSPRQYPQGLFFWYGRSFLVRGVAIKQTIALLPLLPLPRRALSIERVPREIDLVQCNGAFAL